MGLILTKDLIFSFLRWCRGKARTQFHYSDQISSEFGEKYLIYGIIIILMYCSYSAGQAEGTSSPQTYPTHRLIFDIFLI